MTSKNAIVSAILGMLLFFAVSCGDCSERHRRSPRSDNSSAQLDGGISFPEEYNSIQSYPYIADESYCQAVIKNIEGISIGDSYKDICLKLPSATIVRPIYGGIKFPSEQIGFSLWYIFSQKMENGSVKDKAEVGYVIQFNRDGQVSRIYSLGGDNMQGQMSISMISAKTIVNFNDRSSPCQEFDYYFYEDKCFIKSIEFAEYPNEALPKVSYFLVQSIELERLHSLLAKCYDIGCPPPWPPVPVFLLTLFDFDNQAETVWAFLDPEKYKPIINEIKDLTVFKHQIQYVPPIFYEAQYSRILDKIQFVPEHNYP